MPDRAAIERGLEFEAEAATALGLTQTVASGSQHFDRSDAKGRVRLSCKANPIKRRTWGETREQLREAIDLAVGTGETPALAIEDTDGEQFLLLRLADGAALLTEEIKTQRQPSRAEVVREASRIPVLLRDE